ELVCGQLNSFRFRHRKFIAHQGACRLDGIVPGELQNDAILVEAESFKPDGNLLPFRRSCKELGDAIEAVRKIRKYLRDYFPFQSLGSYSTGDDNQRLLGACVILLGYHSKISP